MMVPAKPSVVLAKPSVPVKPLVAAQALGGFGLPSPAKLGGCQPLGESPVAAQLLVAAKLVLA